MSDLYGGADAPPDFIGIYSSFLKKEESDGLTSYVKDLFSHGYGISRQEAGEAAKTLRDDTFIPDVRPLHGDEGPIGELVLPRLTECLTHYVSRYDVLSQQALAGWHMKVQRTQKGQGYHDFHFESSCYDISRRVLAWGLYLNDDFDGGELEFLYYARRYIPKAGELIIFPAAFTHTHRGNMVLSGEKYIMTGWFELIPQNESR